MSNPELEAQKQQCPFCKIVRGEIPSRKVYEDEIMLAVLDINPARKGHVLVLPKEHYFIMPVIPPNEYLHMARITQKLYAAVREAFVADGLTLFMANGGVAGQQAGHFLFHLIPRDANDGLDNFNLFTREINDPQIDQIQRNLMQHVPNMLGSYYQKAGRAVPEDVVAQAQKQKPSLEQLAQMVRQHEQLRQLLLNNRAEFERLLGTHPELKPLFEGVDLDELIKRVQ